MGPSDVKPWIIFAGGGTGGHLFPALSVADALGGVEGDVDISFYVTSRGIDRQVLEPRGYPSEPQVVQPLRLRPWGWWGFLRAWREACAAVRRRFEERRPAMVIGSGGYGAGPPLYVAQKMGIATGLLNPDAVPGRTNRFLGRRAEMVFAQWEVTRAHFPRNVLVQITGCPIRAEFGNTTRAEGVQAFGLHPERKTLLVTGASQGARSINRAMAEVAGSLGGLAGKSDSGEWQVLHLSGKADQESVAAGYEKAGVAAAVLAFTDRMAEALAAADLVISRAGASTLAEITALGRASILFPYPYHRDQHQRVNAEVLSEAGACVALTDHVDGRSNAERLRPVLAELMEDGGKVAAMSAAARRLGRPDAAERVAGLIRQTCLL